GVNPLAQLFEAAFFSAAHPLSLDDLQRLAPEASREEVERALQALEEHYRGNGHAVEVAEVGEGYQLLTRREFAEAIAQAQLVRRPRRLSRAALETLAVIAYRQPVSRAEIEEIRGVSVEGVLRLLQEREVIHVVGRAEGMGRPLLYGTTPQFIELLGIRSLEDLPRLDELSVALRPPADQDTLPPS
ncbi:MAG: SMC-Scp complex subunit ScpB, partial [Gemmatimonadales bacterium]